jgi:hypothetical protein
VLLEALAHDGAIAGDLAASIVTEEGLRGRIWDAFAPFVHNAYFSPTLDELARIAGYSSAEALTHALYAEGLPAPTELRARVLTP